MTSRTAPRRSVRSAVRRTADLVPRRRHLVVMSAMSFGAGLLEAASLLLLARGAVAVTADDDQIGAGPLTLSLTGALLCTAGLLGGKLLLNAASARLASRLASSVLSTGRRQILMSYHRARWSVQSSIPTGKLQDLVSVHIDRCAESVLMMGNLLTAALSLTVLVVSSVAVSPIGALAVIVAGACLSVALRPLSIRGRRLATLQARAGQQFASAVAEGAAAARDVRVAGVDLALVERTMERSQEQVETFRRARFVSQLVGPLYQTVALLILTAGVSMIAAVGDGGTTDVASLGAVVLLLVRALSYGQLAQQAAHQIQERAAYLDELDLTRDQLADATPPGGELQVARPGALVLDEVEFAYERGAPVLAGLTLRIEPGETVGLVGPSGGGKTTLVRLLLRLLEPTGGAITYAGTALADISLDAWYRTVALVPQDPRLLTATVSENIDLLRSFAEPEIVASARSAYLHEEILALPDGYDEVVGPAGVALSGGQQQRLAMARALLGDPKILVLDEPTSALDVHSEARIHDTLAALRGRLTTIIVAHRLSTLVACDRIVVLVRGRIDAVGTHAELMERSTYYAEVVRLSTVGDASRHSST